MSKHKNFNRCWAFGWPDYKCVVVVGLYHLCKGRCLDLGIMVVWAGRLHERWWNCALP